MNRPRALAVRTVACCLLAAGALALRSAAAGEPSDPALRQVAAADLGPEGWSREQAERWTALAAPALRGEVEAEAAGRYGEGWVERAWVVPPQPGVPQGAAFVDGQFVDAPLAEVERRDVRVVTLCGRGGEVALVLPPNAGSPQVSAAAVGGGEALLVVLRGHAWRAGTYLEIYRWEPGAARAERLYSVSGEEQTTPGLCASIEGGPAPRALIYGLADGGEPRAQPLLVPLAPTPRASFKSPAPDGPPR